MIGQFWRVIRAHCSAGEMELFEDKKYGILVPSSSPSAFLMPGKKLIYELIKILSRGSISKEVYLNIACIRYVTQSIGAMCDCRLDNQGLPEKWRLKTEIKKEIKSLRGIFAHRSVLRLAYLLHGIEYLTICPTPPDIVMPSASIDISLFSSLKHIKIVGCDLSHINGLIKFNSQLQSLECHNCTIPSLESIVGPTCDIAAYAWKKLRRLLIVSSKITSLDDSLLLTQSLQAIDVSGNNIETLHHVASCPSVRRVDASFNRISSLSDTAMGKVKTLILHHNAISSLDGIESMRALEHLDIQFNNIKTVASLRSASKLPRLSSVWIVGNPVNDKDVRKRFYYVFPRRVLLNGIKEVADKFSLNHSLSETQDEECTIETKVENHGFRRRKRRDSSSRGAAVVVLPIRRILKLENGGGAETTVVETLTRYMMTYSQSAFLMLLLAQGIILLFGYRDVHSEKIVSYGLGSISVLYGTSFLLLHAYQALFQK